MNCKVISQYACGCQVREITQRIRNAGSIVERPSIVIEYCPLHKAATKLYEALELYQKHQQGTSGHYCWECAEAINKAVAEAEGK